MDEHSEPRQRLSLRGRGSWRRPKPFLAEVVPGSRPYLWLGHGDGGEPGEALAQRLAAEWKENQPKDEPTPAAAPSETEGDTQ